MELMMFLVTPMAKFVHNLMTIITGSPVQLACVGGKGSLVLGHQLSVVG